MEPTETHEWVATLSAGGPERDVALSELQHLLCRRLLRVLGSRAGVDTAFVEDVVQDALVTILGALDQFKAKSKFTTWATTIAIRTAFAEMRRSRWKDVSLEHLMDNQKMQVPDSPYDSEVERDVARNQFLEAMYRIMDEELTEKQRTVLLAELQGMPLKEIGDRLGATRNAIYKLAHDARKRLKKSLIAAGYSAEDLATFQRESR